MTKDLLETALKLIGTSPEAASELIKAAIASLENAPPVPQVQAVVPGVTNEVETCYGCGGRTGPGDPRQPNASHHEDAGGKIMAVHTTVHVVPGSKYRCVNVFTINEDDAKGQTTILVSVKRKDGTVANERVIMATGYNGDISHFDDYLTPGNSYVPVQHTMADEHTGKGCSFHPPDLGPLAIFVAGSSNEQINSDVVGNLGLPNSHHIGFFIEYHER